MHIKKSYTQYDLYICVCYVCMYIYLCMYICRCASRWTYVHVAGQDYQRTPVLAAVITEDVHEDVSVDKYAHIHTYM